MAWKQQVKHVVFTGRQQALVSNLQAQKFARVAGLVFYPTVSLACNILAPLSWMPCCWLIHHVSVKSLECYLHVELKQLKSTEITTNEWFLSIRNKLHYPGTKECEYQVSDTRPSWNTHLTHTVIRMAPPLKDKTSTSLAHVRRGVLRIPVWALDNKAISEALTARRIRFRVGATTTAAAAILSPYLHAMGTHHPSSAFVALLLTMALSCSSDVRKRSKEALSSLTRTSVSAIDPLAAEFMQSNMK